MAGNSNAALGIDIQEEDSHNDGNGSLGHFMRENWGQYVAIYEALRILLTERDNPEYADFFETVDFLTESLAAARVGPFAVEGIELGLTGVRSHLDNLRWRCEDLSDQRACAQIPLAEMQIVEIERALAKFRISQEVGQELWQEITSEIPGMLMGILTGWFNELTQVYQEFGIRGLVNKIIADVVFLAGELFILCAVTALTGGSFTAPLVAMRVSFQFTGHLAVMLTRAGYRTAIDVIVNIDDFIRRYGDDIAAEVGDIDLNRTNPPTRALGENRRNEVVETDEPSPPGDTQTNSPDDPNNRIDEQPDGSYRNPNDPAGVRRTADGEAMIQNREGTWRPVSEMADPNRVGGDDGRRHNPQVGRWGEVQADSYAASQGWERLNGPNTTMESPFTGPQRIDAIYRDLGPPPRIIVSDAKVGNSGQGMTNDGLQMSRGWITARLARAGLSRQDLRIATTNREQVLLRVDKNGNVTEEWLDDAGNAIAAPTWR